MPGLEPGNPEGADLQSAAVAAVPHPHSLFKHLRARIALTSRKDNRGREKCCQSNPPNRAYLYHNSSTYMRCAGAIHPLARRSTFIVGTCTTLPCRALQTRRLATARETDSTPGDNKKAKSDSSCRRASSLFSCCRCPSSLFPCCRRASSLAHRCVRQARHVLPRTLQVHLTDALQDIGEQNAAEAEVAHVGS